MPLPCSPVSHSAPSSDASYSLPTTDSEDSEPYPRKTAGFLYSHNNEHNSSRSQPQAQAEGNPQRQQQQQEVEKQEQEVEADSESDLITPKAGPSDPKLRTQANLSRPSIPLSSSPGGAGFLGRGKRERERERERDSGNSGGSGGSGEGAVAVSRVSGFARDKSQAGALDRQSSNPKAATAGFGTPSLTPSPSPESVKEVPKALSRARSTKSVTFLSHQTGTGAGTSLGSGSARRGMAARSSSQESSRARDGGESSADENTAIFRRSSSSLVPRTGGYGAVGEGGEYDGAGEEGSGGGGRRRRGPERAASSRSKSGRGLSRSGSHEEVPGHSREQVEGVGEGGGEKWGWFRGLIEKYGSVELENKGSTARDHLALERTFLAWLRTSLSFASIGIAITQLFRLNTSLNDDAQAASSLTPAETLQSQTSPSSLLTAQPSRSHLANQDRLRRVGKPLGATFLGISILILLLGFHRYFESQHYVIRGKFPASRGSVILVSLVSAALIVASLVVVVVVAPGAFTHH